MYRLAFITLLSCTLYSSSAQNDEILHAFTVHFKHKGPTQFSLEKPNEFLSQRALERRKKANIPIDSSDLPVPQKFLSEIKSRSYNIHLISKWFNSVCILTKDSLNAYQLENIEFVDRISSVARYRGGIQASESFLPEPLDYDSSFRNLETINGQFIHRENHFGEGVWIAIMDAGFDDLYKHPAFDHLIFNDQIIDSFNFVLNNAELSFKGDHGSAVLSIMGGFYQDSIIGTAPAASFGLYTTENPSSEFPIEEESWIAAAEHADSMGFDIINTSLGYTTFDDSVYNYSPSEMDGSTTRISQAASIAGQKGMLVITSAGNQGNRPWTTISAPADAQNTLSIGAIDTTGYWASFSSIGRTAKDSVKPDVMALGLETIAVYNEKVRPVNGTSFSSPIISGMSACLMSAFPQVTAKKLREVIRRSSSNYNNPNRYSGYGIPDFIESYNYLADDFQRDKIKIENLSVYPNPVKKDLQLQFYFESEKEMNIELINTSGKMVFNKTIIISANKKQLNKINLPLAIPNGVYFLRLYSNDYQEQKKIILNRY